MVDVLLPLDHKYQITCKFLIIIDLKVTFLNTDTIKYLLKWQYSNILIRHVEFDMSILRFLVLSLNKPLNQWVWDAMTLLWRHFYFYVHLLFSINLSLSQFHCVH